MDGERGMGRPFGLLLKVFKPTECVTEAFLSENKLTNHLRVT